MRTSTAIYLSFSCCSISPLFIFPFVSLCHFSLVVFYDFFSLSTFLYLVVTMSFLLKKCLYRDFPGGAVVKNHLPIQGTQVRALVWKDLICHGATKTVRHNHWACNPQSMRHNYWAHVPQLLKPVCLEPVLCKKRGIYSCLLYHR